jgi:hypothetical protein
MTRMRKDLAATAVTALVVLVFAATHEGWDVPLVGGSHRWAAAVILLLGAVGCGLGDADTESRRISAAMVLGVAALVLAVLALVTGSLTALSLLVAATVALWAIATVRHLAHPRARPSLSH